MPLLTISRATLRRKEEPAGVHRHDAVEVLVYLVPRLHVAEAGVDENVKFAQLARHLGDDRLQPPGSSRSMKVALTSASIDAAVWSNPSACLSARRTRAPCSASVRAIASPMPQAAAVTRAVRLAQIPHLILLCCDNIYRLCGLSPRRRERRSRPHDPRLHAFFSSCGWRRAACGQLN